MDTRRVIEIRGVKFDVDMREAITVESLKVGDRVSVLEKKYGDNFACHSGVVVGFEPFKTLPTIILAYIESGYAGGEVKVVAFNDKTEGFEMVKSVDDVLFDKEDAIRALDKKIAAAELVVTQAREAKRYFLEHFGAYWKEADAQIQR